MNKKAVSVCSLLLVAAPVALADIVGRSTMATESPFTSYTAGVVAYVLMVGFLVAALLIGGFLVLNLGLMSKRAEDHIGGRTPSDVGILKGSNWPPEQNVRNLLPAEEDEDVVASADDDTHHPRVA